MRIKILLFFVLGFKGYLSFGQDTISTQLWSGLSLNINSVGGLGLYNPAYKAVEFPVGSGHSPLRRLNFWVTGIRNNGDTVVVVNDIFSPASNWAIGPLGTSSRQHVLPTEWTNILVVSKSEIDYHKLNYAKGGYTMPKGISQWPSNFLVTGFPKILAPFADDNQNGYFDAQNGDYPYVPGLVNTFSMGSDSASMSPQKSKQTGLDMSALWFQPANADTLGSTAYFRLVVCNRHNDSFTQLKISAVADFSIGDLNDDQLGTHVGYNAIYGYNQPGSDGIYGAKWPAVSVGWLSSKASSSIYMFPDNSVVQGKPTQEREFFYYANGYWRSGAKMGSSGSGLDASSSVSKFVYPGTTDPALPQGKNWTNQEGGAGRQTGILSTSAMRINGQTCTAVDGFITVIPDAPDSAAIEKRLGSIVNHYNSQPYTLKLKSWYSKETVAIFPNPIDQGSRLQIPGKPKNWRVLDLGGRVVKEFQNTESYWLVDLKAGIYLMESEGVVPVRLVVR